MHFLFWNTNRKAAFAQHLPRLVSQPETLIGLAECTFPPSYIENLLRHRSGATDRYRSVFQGKKGMAEHLHLYAPFSERFVRVLKETHRYALLSIETPVWESFVLGLVHLQGKLWYDERDQREFARQFMGNLRQVENEVGHDRSVVMGDFNLLPFEEAMTDIGHFNCTFYRDALRRADGRRKFGEEDHALFYNPMLRLAGRNPPATYHHSQAKAVQHYWHQFDQVIVRASLADRFVDDDLKIIDHDGECSLLTEDGVPDETVSDHLPFEFRMHFQPREVTP